VGNFLLTGGVIFRQTREEFVQTGVAHGRVWTVLEGLMRDCLGR
jgi:hypothetical protein